jgi:HEAT repeat protein
MAGGQSVAHWVQELKNADPKARRYAVEKLGNVGAQDPTVLPALRDALEDSDARVRAEAIVALMKCGKAAKEAIPTLLEMQTKDSSTLVREYAGRALTKLNENAN